MGGIDQCDIFYGPVRWPSTSGSGSPRIVMLDHLVAEAAAFLTGEGQVRDGTRLTALALQLGLDEATEYLRGLDSWPDFLVGGARTAWGAYLPPCW